MNQQPKPTRIPPSLLQNIETDPSETYYLRQIAEHLKAIRSMMTFFTVILILSILIQVFT